MTDPRSPQEMPRSLLARVLSGASWSAAGRLGGTVGLVMVLGAVSRVVSPEDAGIYVVCQSAALLGAVLAGFGLGPVIIRMIQVTSDRAAYKSLRSGVRRAALINTTASVIVALAGFAIVLVMKDHVAHGHLRTHAEWIVGWMLLSVASQMTGEVYRGLRNFPWAGLIGGQTGGMLVNPLLAITILVLSHYGEVDLSTVFLLQLSFMGAALCCALVRLIIVLSRLPREDETVISECQPTTSWLLTEAWPIAITQMFVFGVIQLDILIIGSVGVEAEQNAAMFSGVRSIMMLLTAPLQILNVSLSPFIAELFVENRKRELESLLRLSATAASIPAILVLSVMLAVPELILESFFAPGFRAAATALMILAVANVVFVLCGSCGLALTMTGNQRTSMWISVWTGLIYLLLLPILIHQFGLAGAAGCAAGRIIISNIVSTLWVRKRIGVWATATVNLCDVPSRIRLLRHARRLS